MSLQAKDTVVRLSTGHRLGYTEYGDPMGKPVFSIHGWPSSRLHASVFAPIAEELGVRVIAPDRQGFGISEYDPKRTLLDWPDTILELADHLNVSKFSVLGISGGGPYAISCAYKIPKKRLHAVGVVVGLGPPYVPGVLDGMPPWPAFCWKNYPTIPGFRFVAAFSYWLVNILSPSLNIHARIFGAASDRMILTDISVRREFQCITGEAFRSGIRGPALDLKLYSHDWGIDLQKITVPVHLWYGAEDRAVPLATGRYYRKMIPKSTLRIYPGEGHFVIRKHAREILKRLI